MLTGGTEGSDPKERDLLEVWSSACCVLSCCAAGWGQSGNKSDENLSLCGA